MAFQLIWSADAVLVLGLVLGRLQHRGCCVAECFRGSHLMLEVNQGRLCNVIERLKYQSYTLADLSLTFLPYCRQRH